LSGHATLINLLSDNQWHTGGSLGDRLGVSRNAIWKQMTAIEGLGLEVERSKLKGYRLLNDIDLIDEHAVQQAVSRNVYFESLDYLDVLGSTNDHLLSKLPNERLRSVCIAEQQTAGRGRRGRQWLSPYGQNLYMSFLWPVLGGAQSMQGLSLAVGVVVAEVLSRAGVEGVGLKWPNDLLVDTGKVGGILIDVTGDPQGELVAVIGLGVNLTLLESQQSAISQPAQGVRAMGLDCTRTELAVQLIEAMGALLSTYEAIGFDAYLERFMSMDRFKGAAVKMLVGGNEIFGVASGVDADGQYLIVRDDTGELQAFSGGEVSLRCQ